MVSEAGGPKGPLVLYGLYGGFLQTPDIAHVSAGKVVGVTPRGFALQETAESSCNGRRRRRAAPAWHLFAALIPICVMAAHTRAHAQGAAPERRAPAQAPAPYADSRLPFGAPARITIRYPVENAAARQRATDLARGLSEQGLDVADPVASPGRIASNTVSFFYAEDRPGAEIAARVLGPAWKLVQQRLPTREPFPPPGALELALAGQ